MNFLLIKFLIKN